MKFSSFRKFPAGGDIKTLNPNAAISIAYSTMDVCAFPNVALTQSRSDLAMGSDDVELGDVIGSS